MSIWERIKRLFRSNVNDLITNAIDGTELERIVAAETAKLERLEQALEEAKESGSHNTNPRKRKTMEEVEEAGASAKSGSPRKRRKLNTD